MGVDKVMIQVLRQLERDWVRDGMAREGDFLDRCEACGGTGADSCRERSGLGCEVTHQGWQMLAWAKPSGCSRHLPNRGATGRLPARAPVDKLPVAPQIRPAGVGW